MAISVPSPLSIISAEPMAFRRMESCKPPGQYNVPTKTLIIHYDGTGWTVVPSPNMGPHSQYQNNQLRGITAVSPNDIWAFGSCFAADGSGQQSTLTGWTVVPSPNMGPHSQYQNNQLRGITAVSP